MLIYSLDQERALGRNPLTVPTGHTLDTKCPWSTYTGFLAGNVKPEDAAQGPAVAQLLRGTQPLSPGPLTSDPADNESHG